MGFIVRKSEDGSMAAVCEVSMFFKNKVTIDLSLHRATNMPAESHDCGKCKWVNGQRAQVTYGFGNGTLENTIMELINQRLDDMLEYGKDHPIEGQ